MMDHQMEHRRKIKSFSDERICYFEYDVNTSFKTLDMLRERARGKYIAQIGSDDVWRKDKLEKQVVFRTESAVCCMLFLDRDN